VSFKGRLGRLEGRMPDQGRCDVCRDWPGGRIVYVNDWREESDRRDAGPERCPACRWAPRPFVIEYVDTWPPRPEVPG
jgi:hypothetical protein